MRTMRACAMLMLAGVTLLLGGCPTPTYVTPILTPTLAYLAAHVEDMRTDDTPIEGDPVTADTLAGCWGRALTTTQSNAANVTLTMTAMDAYQFDADTGTVTQSVYLREEGGSYAIALIGTGTYTVSGDEIHIVIEGWLGNDPTTGDINIDAGEGEDYTLVGTVSGNQLMLAAPDGEDGQVAVYTGFACQE